MDLDGLRDKAEDFAGEHAEQIEKGIDKAEELAKQRVQGHDKQIEEAADKLRGFVQGEADKEPPTPSR